MSPQRREFIWAAIAAQISDPNLLKHGLITCDELGLPEGEEGCVSEAAAQLFHAPAAPPPSSAAPVPEVHIADDEYADLDCLE